MLSCQRDAFSIPDEVHYLNCAYMSPLSRRVEAAGIAALRRKRDPWTITPADFFDGLARVKGQFARLIGANDPGRIAVIPSVSYGMSTVARNTAPAPGHNIVMVEHQFPSNVYPWRRLARTAGAQLRVVAPPPGERQERGAQWNVRLLESIDERTALVAIGQVHWTDGTLFDLERVAERARAVGAALVVDGTQSVGALPFAVDRVRPDALVCAGYKWLLGPYALGLAYFGPRYDGGEPLEETWLARPDSENFRNLVVYRDDFRAGAVRYDVGEASNFALLPMLEAALDQVLEWSVPAIAAYCGAVTKRLADEVRALGFEAEDEAWRAPHILGLRMPAHLDADDVRHALGRQGVYVSARGSVVRIAPYLYNDEQDCTAVLEGLEALSARRLPA